MTRDARSGPSSGGAARGGRGGPLRAVLAAFDAGAGDLGEVAERTGLDRGVVMAAVEHLIRGGQLQAERLTVGCPATGCSSCGSYTAPDPASGPVPSGWETTLRSGGCGGGGGTAPVEGRGPVVITVTPRRGR